MSRSAATGAEPVRIVSAFLEHRTEGSFELLYLLTRQAECVTAGSSFSPPFFHRSAYMVASQ